MCAWAVQLGLTSVADLTPEEFAAQLLTYQPSAGPAAPTRKLLQVTGSTPGLVYYPHSARTCGNIDWRTKGVVTPVRDQGQVNCG